METAQKSKDEYLPTTTKLWTFSDKSHSPQPVSNILPFEFQSSRKISSGALSVNDLFAALSARDPDFEQGVREERAALADALYGEKRSLKRLRLSKGLSQTELAEAIGQKQPNIYRYEHGRTEPTLDVIAKLAKALDVAPGTLTEILLEQNGD